MNPTWIFVAGIYRSASTTQYEMCRDIVQGIFNGVGIGIGYHTENRLKKYDDDKYRLVVCKVFEPLFEGFRGEPSYAKKFFDENRALAIATMRDPRDVATSMKRRSEGRNKKGQEDEWSFEKTVQENFPVWFGNLDKWYEWGAMQTKYEEFTLNLYREAKRIARHIGVRADDSFFKTVAKKYSIQNIQEIGQKDKGALPSRPGIVFGTSGIHKTWLTAPERKMVENSVGWFIEKYGYE
jgi:hypothetical protein